MGDQPNRHPYAACRRSHPGRATAAQMRGIRHEMIDVAEPVRKPELNEYVAAAREHLGTALANGELPMIVGGTGV